jgi:LacI family repressor for deo operon, udp, cdd, tsx, nupC, and nupG
MAARIRASSRSKTQTVTILDVARRAGVSTATVSRALAAPERVADKTRAAVEAAIAETGYTPNAIAQGLRARSSKMVLALLPGLGNSFYTVIINAVEELLTEAGYGILFGDTRNDAKRDAHYDRLVRSGQVDGVLLLTGRLPRKDFAELDATVPITLVSNDIPEIKTLPVFEIANREAAREMVEYLIRLGHRRIAHITGPAGNIEARERLRGYRDALAAAGLPIDESLIWPGSFTFIAGTAAAKQYLASSDRPTAVFAASDEIAMGFIRAIKDAGLRVPDDLSVAGFDDIEYASFFDPALTTMHQPRAELGRLAAESLVRRMAGDSGPKPPRRTRLACTLVIRASVKPLAAPAGGSKRKAPIAVSEPTARDRRAAASR